VPVCISFSVDENGDIIFDRDTGFAPEILEVEISEVDGAVYVSTNDVEMLKFDENGYYDTGFDLPAMHSTHGFDLNYADHLWISGIEVIGDYGLYEYDSAGGYINGFEGFYPADNYFDDNRYEVWAGGGAPLEPGVHKFTEDGTLLFYLSEYRPRERMDGNSLDGSFWFANGRYGKWELDVNESDGSVWVASNIPKRLVHLDKDGNRMLYKQWPGGDFAHLAVDQRNGTCIVIYEEYRSGDLNIQPASVGEIKAMYAGEGR
jgi:hypothetical protein